MDRALESTRSLNAIVRQVLKSNINMSHQLRNVERMHPALAASNTSSCASLSIQERGSKRTISPVFFGFTFEEDLKTSRVYKRVALNESRFSRISSTNSIGYSFLSGLSLSDVSDISAIPLPISPMDLWNHHRYGSGQKTKTGSGASSLEAWYNPPSKVGRVFLIAVDIEGLTTRLEQRIYTNCLLQRTIHQSVCSNQIHRPSTIQAIYDNSALSLTNLYRRSGTDTDQ